MTNDILVEVSSGETKVAILENRDLVEFYIEKLNPGRLVGNIYRGKVQSVLPGIQAAFVDIGYNKNAFLYINDAISNNCYTYEDDGLYNDVKDFNISDILTQGQEITVQVIKEPLGNKGPRVTTHITLPGRYLVLLPNADYIGISRRIDNESEKNRLKKLVEKIKPEGMGIIVRTVAEGIGEEDFAQDVNFLMKLWISIHERENKGNVPRCLHTDYNLLYRTVRDYFASNTDKLIVNDLEQYNKILEYVDMFSPSLKNKIQYFSKSKSVFEYYQIDYRLSKALTRKVWLKCGGYIVIDRTEALTVIDVNTGKYVGSDNLEDTVLKTNMDAAAEISRQLRLRDIGGIIIIDFIDMNNDEHKKMVLNALKIALRKDRTKTTVIGMTGLGLIEMTRKKVGYELANTINDECPYCKGTGKNIHEQGDGRINQNVNIV